MFAIRHSISCDFSDKYNIPVYILSFVLSLISHTGFIYNVYTPRQIQILRLSIRVPLWFVSAPSGALRITDCTTDVLVERAGCVNKMHGANFTNAHLIFEDLIVIIIVIVHIILFL